MDNRKDALRSVKVCRFCLSEEAKLSSLYDKSRSSKNEVTLPLQILSCVSIEVFPSDGMPTQICDRCRFFMDISYHYKQMCRQAEESILQFLETGEPLEPISWPPKLVKLFQPKIEDSGTKESVKTLVTESGACVQVQTDSEEDANNDEKVFNIKIASDGSQSLKRGSSFRVITGQEKIEIIDNDSSVKQKSAAGADRWACERCHRAYPLRQLLELHRAQQHRQRDVVCRLCGDEFFTKYDLMTHQLSHYNKTPFECVACDKRFNRLGQLKRHEKTKHADLARHYCQDCPLNFLSSDDLEAHQLQHRRYDERRYSCDVCGKKFDTKRTLSRHKDAVHRVNLLFACELCPQRYSTGPKLARHVRTHARGSDYPCKYCNKVFFKSHHYTRHLRLKHKDCDKPRGATKPSATFRCDECEQSFKTQDELIYHSAYHATQNLTCPLCQEKFDDVDAVTTHIKSHVDSEQFMCDLCELVFTSQERLDVHLAVKHEDELQQEEESNNAGEDSMEMDPDEDDEDQNFSVKEEGDHMVVEIKKPNEFTLTKITELPDVKSEKSNEGNEPERTYTELATVDTLEIAKQQQFTQAKLVPEPKPKQSPVKRSATPAQTPAILYKAEEVKRKGLQQKVAPVQKSNKEAKLEKASSNSSSGTSDKSLRLLEKELKELQRTSSARNESGKSTPSSELARRGRLQIHTSTPKPRSIESRKILLSGKTVEKRSLERIPTIAKETKENKESKENRDSKNNNTGVKDEKEPKDQPKPKDQKIKNGIEKVCTSETAQRVGREDSVRRSSRPSKIKNYAKMIRDGTQVSDNDDDDYDSEEDDEAYEDDAEPEPRGRQRKVATKAASTPAPIPTKASEATPPAAVRKRGRPRKADKKRRLSAEFESESGSAVPLPPQNEIVPPSPTAFVSCGGSKASTSRSISEASAPVKIKKLKQESDHEADEEGETPQPEINKIQQPESIEVNNISATADQTTDTPEKSTAEEKSSPRSPPPTPPCSVPVEVQSSPMLLSPTGQTLKKIPVKALPPGIKPLPLFANARPMGQLCEMQIGEKVMKVQKIVMTKEKVEQLTKQGLIEMKAGTMVLKTGYKLAASGDSPGKSAPGTPDSNKESSTNKKEKPTPTRCDLQEES